MTHSFESLRQIRNGDATITYAVLGPSRPNTPTICLIASTGRGPQDFFHLAHALASGGMRVVLPWPRGSDKSTGDMTTATFHDLAADAAAALRTERTGGPSYIAGHAYGCWIARTVAQDFPDLVSGLILLSAGGGKWPKELSSAIDVIVDQNQPDLARLAALKLAFFSEENDPSAWLEGWFPDLVSQQRAARARTEKDSWWGSGSAPILDIVGLQDPFRPADARDFYVQTFAPRVTQHLIDGASHAMPDEVPNQVAQAILEWSPTR